MKWEGRRQSDNIRDLREGVSEMAGTVTLDVGRINKVFQQGVPEFKAKLDAKAAKDLHPAVANALAGAAQNFLGIPGTEKIDASILTACTAWPKIRNMLNFGLKIAGWYPGYKTEIALAKSWLAMADTELIPQICAVDGPAAAAKK